MENVAVKYIPPYLETNDLMNPGKNDFLAGLLCLSPLLEHHENILTSLEEGYNVDVLYLDFKKAFDKIDHGVLLHKLKKLGVYGALGR